MQTYGWAALTAIIAATSFSACNGVLPTPRDSNAGSGGERNDSDFFAAEDDPDGMGGARSNRPRALGGAAPFDPGVLCERFIEFDDPKTAYNRAKREVASTFPGYIHRDCRIRGFANDPKFLTDMPNQVISLTLQLWRCDGYELEKDYIPAFDFPLSLQHWQMSTKDIEAFTEAYLAQVKNSALELTDFELEYFREEIARLAQGAANQELQGFSRSTCNDGLGGGGGLGGASMAE